MLRETSTSTISVNQLPCTIWGLAFTELWERFSFYGLNGILTLYLYFNLQDGGLELPKAAAAGIVGAYGGSVYLAQLLGAWLGERVMSPKWMVFWGGLVITAGHLVLAVIPGITGVAVGLVLIILGTGALKTNITNIVGIVVDGRDEGQRDVGFAYFYLAINVGAVLGPMSTGFVQNEWGFHWGFGLAAIGMTGALVQYVVSMRKLPERTNVVARPIARARALGIAVGAALVGTVVGLLLATGSVRAEQLASVATVLILLAAAWYFIMMLSAKSVSRDEKRRVAAYLPLFLAAGVYFGLLFQQFTAITFLITERVDLVIGGWSMPVPWITMISQLSAVLITPVIARFWGRSGNDGPGAPAKFALGLVQMGLAYVLMMVALILFPETPGVQIPLLLVIVVMIVAGSSEVFIGPIGLSLATRIGPAAFKLQLIGLNALTLALGSSISGLLGQLFEVMDPVPYFVVIVAIGLGLGVALWLFRTPLQRALSAGLR
ncbi:peptide transporter [Leucobacter sp. UCD-THU]|uniref:peptide MFS transporter n=1 Tax=Leucobacter sp. UCD-THU TaxID=1292023 RepID=UPI0003621815|nr:oligopeptide:H+ symporter [Leucobacter sp. UCD-THU]EYT52855.1 peptide transporter [Leucobacter sp. UCD-THU]